MNDVEREKEKESFMNANDLDKIFDDGKVDFNEYLDLSKAFRPGQELKRVNVDFSVWMIEQIDKESSRLGVPRQSLFNVWIAEKLEAQKPSIKSNQSGKEISRSSIPHFGDRH